MKRYVSPDYNEKVFIPFLNSKHPQLIYLNRSGNICSCGFQVINNYQGYNLIAFNNVLKQYLMSLNGIEHLDTYSLSTEHEQIYNRFNKDVKGLHRLVIFKPKEDYFPLDLVWYNDEIQFDDCLLTPVERYVYRSGANIKEISNIEYRTPENFFVAAYVLKGENRPVSPSLP